MWVAVAYRHPILATPDQFLIRHDEPAVDLPHDRRCRGKLNRRRQEVRLLDKVDRTDVSAAVPLVERVVAAIRPENVR